MIGNYITDDFYLFFEEEDIKTLAEKSKLEGDFAVASNNLPERILKMKAHVVIFDRADNPTPSLINVSFRQKIVKIYLLREEFNKWLLDPDEWTRKNGPNWRTASSNVYMNRSSEKNSELQKQILQNIIDDAVEE